MKRDTATIHDEVSGKFLANVLKCDVRSIQNFVKEGMPQIARNKYSLEQAVPWYVDREREAARAGRSLNELDLARQRKTLAEAQEAELRVAKMLGELIDTEVHQEVVGQVCDRLMPILQNLPSNYGLRLEQQGLKADKAEAVLEAIANELTGALRATADEFDNEAEEEDSGKGTRAAG